MVLGIVADAGADTVAEEEPAPTMVGESGTPPTDADSANPARKIREGTKQATLIAMLKRPEGATIAEIMETSAWQAHSIRGFIAGALKKKLGLDVTSEKVDARGRVYRIAQDADAAA
jgi:hypothetical protein